MVHFRRWPVGASVRWHLPKWRKQQRKNWQDPAPKDAPRPRSDSRTKLASAAAAAVVVVAVAAVVDVAVDVAPW